MAAGLGIFEVISAGAGLVGAGMQAHEQDVAEQNQEQALQMQETQVKSKAAQEQIARDKSIQQVQSSQRARAVAQGMSLTSGTYSALSNASYNAFAQDTNISNLNLSNQETQINAQMDADQSKLHTQLWGDLVSGISDVGGLISSGRSLDKESQDAGSQQDDDFDKKLNRTYMSPEGDYDFYLRHSGGFF